VCFSFFQPTGLPVVPSCLGNVLSTKGKVDAAIAAFTEAVRLDPNYAESHHNLARLHFQQKKYTVAITFTRNAIKVDAKHPHADAVLGISLLQMGDISGARSALTEAAKFDKHWEVDLAKLPPVAVAPSPGETKQ
jgi:Flp pilus assembly protein TadD